LSGRQCIGVKSALEGLLPVKQLLGVKPIPDKYKRFHRVETGNGYSSAGVAYALLMNGVRVDSVKGSKRRIVESACNYATKLSCYFATAGTEEQLHSIVCTAVVITAYIPVGCPRKGRGA